MDSIPIEDIPSSKFIDHIREFLMFFDDEELVKLWEGVKELMEKRGIHVS